MAMPVFTRKDDLGPAGHGFGELGYQPVAFDRERGAHDIRSVLHEQAKCSASQIRRFVVFGNVEADFGSPDDHLNRLVIAKLDVPLVKQGEEWFQGDDCLREVVFGVLIKESAKDEKP